MDIDVGSLPDSELRQHLLDYGVNVGPIVSSTRLFYEKKLCKLIQSQGESEPEESEEEEEEEEEEDDEVQINYRAAETRPKPEMKPQFTSTPVTQTDYAPVTQARVATPTQAVRRNIPSRTENQSPTSSDSENKQSGGGVSMLLKLVFLAVVVFLVYLVVINMNPSAEDKIPLTYEDSNV